MISRWKNSIYFSVAYLACLFSFTLTTIISGEYLDLTFPAVGIGDFVQQFSSQAISPIIGIFIAATSPQFLWIAASAVSFLLPLVADLEESARSMTPGKISRNLARVGSLLGAFMNLGVAIGIYTITVRPDLNFGSQFRVVAFAVSPSLAASVAFAVLLIATWRRKTDKL